MPIRSVTVQQRNFFRGSLTPRQSQTLALLAEGKSTNEIAVLMGVSDKTVELHKLALRFKLDKSEERAMHPGEVYHLTTPTLGLMAPIGDLKVPVMIPRGATLTVLRVDAVDERFFYVTWKDDILAVLATDLTSRGHLVEATVADAG